MGQEKPLVSIIVRTKDRPGLLRRALKSIASQTYRPLEVVLVNDGGGALDSAGLQALLGDVRLNYIPLERNTGRANAGNVGIQRAAGSFLAFLDDDDEYYPEHIARLQSFILEGNADICYADCEVRRAEYDEAADTLKELSSEPFLSYDFDYSFLLFTNYIPVICTLFRKEVFERAGGFDTSFELYEDWDLLIRAGETCSVRHLKGVSAIYNRWDPGSQITGEATSGDYAKDRLYYTRIIDKHRIKYTGDALYSMYVIYNHLSLKYTAAETLKNFLEREYKRIEAEKSRLDNENAGLWEEKSKLGNEISRLSDSNLRLEHENLRLEENGLRLEEKNLGLEGSLRTREEKIRVLEEKAAALSSLLARIQSSRGWRLLTKYYNAKEFITGTDLKPDLFERTRDTLKRATKKALPKKHHIYIRLLIYHLLNRKNEDKLPSGAQGGKPFISIIIPVYNRSAFLRQALESALDQDYDAYEVIAVDDCSAEQETREILTEFSGRQGRLRVFFNEKNSGISETMNSAIIHARGDYIAFLDCDDFLPREALSKASAAIMRDPDKGYYFSDRINVDINAKEIERVTFINRRRDNYLRELMKGMFTDHLKIIRKDAFLEAGFHDRKFDSVQDYEFALRYAFRYPAGFGYINDYLYCHRVYPEQISTKQAGHQKKLAEAALDLSRSRISIREGRSGKKISIVILSFNKKEHTLKCVESIKATVRGDYEIIIFDNKSGADTVELLTRTFSDDKKVRLFFSEENLGCPGGRKKALSYAEGDYIVTLDNDIIVTDGWIEDLILRVEEGSDVAGACCKVIFPDNKIQYNGGKAVINNGFVEFTLIDAWKSMNELTTMRRHECDWIPGGATLYKSRIYEKVSVCDEFRNAFEDNDFSFNVRKLGYRLLNCPTARVIHNHVMYDRKSALQEKDYMASRYSHEALKQSVLAFYRRHGYIIKDEYVYRVFGLNGLDENEIRQKFIEMAKG